MPVFQLLPEYQVAHERAVYKAIAIVADTKKVVQNMNIEKLAELRAMSKPIIDIEDLMATIIMICKYWSPAVTSLSPACHQLVTSLSVACHQHVSSLSPASKQLVSSFSPACYHLGTSLLLAYLYTTGSHTG